MADSFTANLNLRKPEVGAALSTWGTSLNGDCDLLDAVFLATGLGTSIGVHVGTGKVLNVEGTAKFADSTDTTKIAKLDSSLIATATTRTYQFPDEDGVLATKPFLTKMVPTGTVWSGYYGNTPPTGFVFLDGRTIGDSTSGATNRANADTQALFALLWPFTTIVVLPSRGANAAADWAAHRTITLPNHSGRVMCGRDNLSGTAANIMPGATTDGVIGGSNLSSTGTITSTGTTRVNFGNAAFTLTGATAKVAAAGVSGLSFGGGGGASTINDAVSVSAVTGYTTLDTGNYSISVAGASGNFSIVQPTISVDVIIAL